MIRIGILGAGGRMGRAVAAALAGHERCQLSAAFSRPGSAYIGEDAFALAGRSAGGVAIVGDLDEVIAASDVLVDFTRPEFTVQAAEICARLKKPLVSGTTGLDDPQYQTLAALAGDTGILHAPNMSVGVNLMLHVLREAAARLGEDYDVEILETHHRHKVDAPSGTAIAMGEAIADARGGNFDELVEYGRIGRENQRQPGRIGMHSLRAGEVVGEHDARFVSTDEELRIGHTAFRRDAFAGGALRAAEWLYVQPPGLYGMRDMLGLD